MKETHRQNRNKNYKLADFQNVTLPAWNPYGLHNAARASQRGRVRARARARAWKFLSYAKPTTGRDTRVIVRADCDPYRGISAKTVDEFARPVCLKNQHCIYILGWPVPTSTRPKFSSYFFSSSSYSSISVCIFSRFIFIFFFFYFFFYNFPDLINKVKHLTEIDMAKHSRASLYACIIIFFVLLFLIFAVWNQNIFIREKQWHCDIIN